MAVAVTQLAEALDDSETGIDVDNDRGFPSSGQYTIRIDSEWMRVTAGWGTGTLTVTRGYNSTTAAEHDDDSAVYHVPDTYASLDRVKNRLAGGGTESTSDDDILSDLIDAVQSYMVGRIGMFFGPTTTTSIDVDGNDAIGSGIILPVPFGIQSLTSIQVQPTTGATFETVTAADVVSGPREWEPKIDANQPYTWLMFKDIVTGSHTSFPEGIGNVRITGTLGWSEPPNRLGELADTMVIRMFHAAQSGQRDVIGTDEEGEPVVSRFISSTDERVLRMFKAEVSGHRWV